MDQPKYRIEIFWSDEDDGYIANVPALQYCSAFGETYEEALSEVLVAMELHLDTLQELDRPIPEPDGRRLSKRFFENWVETLEDQDKINHRKLQGLQEDLKELSEAMSEAQKRAIQESSQEVTKAYLDFLNSVSAYYRNREGSQRSARN